MPWPVEPLGPKTSGLLFQILLQRTFAQVVINSAGCIGPSVWRKPSFTKTPVKQLMTLARNYRQKADFLEDHTENPPYGTIFI